MKKINEEILKYLSGMMDASEIKLFEEKLGNSEELRIQVDNVKETLGNLDVKNVELSDAYFNNLLPRVRQRLENEKKSYIFKKLYYLAPALTIVLLVVLFYPRSNSINEYNYQDLAQVVVNNINDTDVADNYMSDNLFYPSYNTALDNSDFSVGLENANENVPDSYLKLMDYSGTETYSMLSNMSDEDLERLYKELNNIKFQ